MWCDRILKISSYDRLWLSDTFFSIFLIQIFFLHIELNVDLRRSFLFVCVCVHLWWPDIRFTTTMTIKMVEQKIHKCAHTRWFILHFFQRRVAAIMAPRVDIYRFFIGWGNLLLHSLINVTIVRNFKEERERKKEHEVDKKKITLHKFRIFWVSGIKNIVINIKLLGSWPIWIQPIISTTKCVDLFFFRFSLVEGAKLNNILLYIFLGITRLADVSITIKCKQIDTPHDWITVCNMIKIDQM